MGTRRRVVLALLAVLLLAGCARTVRPTAKTTTEPTRSITAANEPTQSAEATATGGASPSIAEVLKSTPDLSTMSKLVDAAGMTIALAGTKPDTLLAPSDAAFEKLPEGMLATLRDPANKEKLRKLLRYHLIMGQVPVEQMVTIRRVMTYQGGVLTVASKDGTVAVDGTARITRRDVAASNGFVDVIDTVLVPPGFEP